MIELTVIHNGKNWIARNSDLVVQAPTLEMLDTKLTGLLRQKGYARPGEKLRVFMVYDNASIPQWIRQYSQHYFNRVIEVEL
jgi:hypothetical protein